MADDEAEAAFFQAQAIEAETANASEPAFEEPGPETDDDEYDPSKALGDDYEDHEPLETELSDEKGPADDSTEPNIPEPNSGLAADEQDPSHAESHSSTPAPEAAAVPQTKTIGGFVDEDDEEDPEEADYEPPAALEVEDPNAITMTMSENPNLENENQKTSPDAYHQAVEGASSSDVANSSYPNIYPSAPAPDPALWGSHDPSVQNSIVPTPVPESPSTSKGRLPHDRVGILQDRIDEDPRGDIPAWLELISEHRGRHRLDAAREVFENFLKIFPMAAEQWVAYATMESELNEFYRLEQIFSRSLITVPSVSLCGQARQTISSAYEMALKYVGMDKDSGNMWNDYLEFIRSGPGTVGGSGWQDQQKMDLMRKAYQKAICVPTQAVNTLWKEYDQFEMGLNKLTGRKFLQEQSPSYMTARSSYTELQNITRDLIRTSLPRLPPVAGSDGDIEFAQQVDIWKRWIAWEKNDPLVLKDDDPASFKARVVYVYKQALMALRFLPEIWFEASEFCFLNGMETEGNELLKQGTEANPESCLLSFKRADRLEMTSESEQDSSARAAKVREPYDALLTTLYDLIAKAKKQEDQDVVRIEETFAKQNPNGQHVQNDDEDDAPVESKEQQSIKQAQIDAVRKAHGFQINLLSKTISFAWIALMRSMRRIQGKGKPGESAGSRQVFAEARKRGRITSDVYIASALMEHHCYKDPAATKIFERGARLFPEDENFALEYLKHLIDINDIINARVVFETTVRKLASNPENVHKAKPIFAFLHEYESRYGDLVQVTNLENRMRELYPDDPTLDQFAHRYSTPTFDPVSVRLILSPSQTRPKSFQPVPMPGQLNSPREADLSSPKRSYPDDLDYDSDRPRKFARAESPLKSAQGRRLDQQKRGPSNGQPTYSYMPQGSATPLPRDVVHLLSIIPAASYYNIARLSPEKMVDLLRRVEVPASTAQIPLPANARGLGAGSGGGNPYTGELIAGIQTNLPMGLAKYCELGSYR
ncbi:RNA-processing protein HAT helix [Penicillium chermesinum]|nr:RNA-processing protein HAT helix [Penicillium chermesinum]